MIETQIAKLQRQADSLLIDRGRIIDHLLDLRLEADGRPDVLAALDAILSDVPGLTVVESDWWLEQLEGLAAVAKPLAAT